ncbi:hypothetical protein [Neptunomonas qingdaonensis]|uniref:Helix-turn-helix domain-containing protein n=1 Tax=Neptunomonas qingdaonensis TaxID=1045558 RepID=A0A1I2N206_9GAMM|nr:hypothetical protein [Neptunomonas qingdaonensis]SFF97894.1 hypothetical protein SAMN05216175_102250 [Neptunomonas qingdaonensis]
MASRDRKSTKRFAGIPFSVLQSQQGASLKAAEVKLLIDLLFQFNGHNNGVLSPCLTLMKKRGWASSSLYRAFRSLEDKGFLVVTRQGWKVRGRPTLVAITWNGIDEPKGLEYDKDIKPNPVPLAYWCKDKSTWKHKPKEKTL